MRHRFFIAIGIAEYFAIGMQKPIEFGFLAQVCLLKSGADINAKSALCVVQSCNLFIELILLRASKCDNNLSSILPSVFADDIRFAESRNGRVLARQLLKIQSHQPP